MWIIFFFRFNKKKKNGICSMETIKSWTLSHEGLLLKVNDCYAVIHASVETVFGLCIYVYVLLVLCLFFFLWILNMNWTLLYIW